jgi:nucleolar protein 56
MSKYIYSSIAGTFVINEEGKITDRRLFSEEEVLSNARLLIKGSWTESEKEMLKKHPEAVYLGFKEEANNVKTEFSLRLFDKASKELSDYKENIKNFNLLLTESQLKEAVNEDDKIMQLINSIHGLEKAANLLTKKLRDWYELYDMELSKSLAENEDFIKTLMKLEKHNEIDKDELKIMLDFASRINELYEYRNNALAYLERVMKEYCPNLDTVAGATIGADLIAHAGSLQRLATLPASVIQLLGAERALFRHLRNKRSKPPKHGIIINHPIVLKSRRKGRGARILADKISIAARIDFFKGEFLGDKLLKELEAKVMADG